MNTIFGNEIVKNVLTLKNIIIYLLIMNVVNFILMCYDKNEAKKHEWRISEKTFFIISLIGGSIGGLLGMKVFHHKTKKWYFKYGFLVILLMQICLTVFILQRNIL